MNVVLKMLDLLCKLKNQIPSLKVSTVLQSHTCVLLAVTWYISLLSFMLITQPSRRRQPSLGFDVVVVGGGGGFFGFFLFSLVCRIGNFGTAQYRPYTSLLCATKNGRHLPSLFSLHKRYQAMESPSYVHRGYSVG